jgi:hypothetical protein
MVRAMRAAEYDRLAGNLRDFLVAFGDLANGMEIDPDSYPQRWRVKPGHESRIDSIVPRVAALSGPAAYAFDAAGVYVDYKPAGTRQTQPVNPAVPWSTILDGEPMVEPLLMYTTGQQALGLLENARNIQAERERGFIGEVAWFFTLAPRVREAAGLEKGSVGGTTVSWSTAIAQGVIVGLLVALVARLLGLGP